MTEIDDRYHPLREQIEAFGRLIAAEGEPGDMLFLIGLAETISETLAETARTLAQERLLEAGSAGATFVDMLVRAVGYCHSPWRIRE